MLTSLKKDLEKAVKPGKKEVLERFFKTRKGQYAEGAIFLGIGAPKKREIAKKYTGLSFPKIQELLNSKIHDYRFTALIILNNKYKQASNNEKANIFNFYMKNTKNVNNWDLVDLSAPNIVGDFLSDKDKNILYELIRSENLWERRIGILSTFYFIKKQEFEDALAISELLLDDNHDLIHKAVGWMLREIGKKDVDTLETFLRQHHKKMPRTMLRYAIERFPEEKRKKYLKGEIK